MWRFGGLSWWRLAGRVLKQSGRDEVIGRAAELAYFFLFSVFPLLLFLTTLIGYLARDNWGLRQELFQWVGTVSPSGDVTSLLRDTLREVTEARGGARLGLSLALAVIIASNGMEAVGRVLNTACGLQESRPWWQRRLIAIVLVTVFAVLILAGLVVIFFGSWLAERLSSALDMGAGFSWVWQVTQWSIVLAFVILAFDLVYNFAPNLARRHRVWFTPGACAGVALWLVASFGLRIYLSNFGFYTKAYGSLGAVIVLLLWFYVTAVAVLVGGEVNSEVAVAALGDPARHSRSRG